MSESTNNLINRREALKRAAWLLGGAISAPVAMGFLQGCSSNPGRKAQFFTEEQAELIAQIADIMIPETDTPGAREAGVPAYIEDQVFVIWEEDDRNYFLKNLSEFEAKAEKDLGQPFIQAGEEERTAYIHKLHDEVFRNGEVDWDAPRPFIWQMKELTVTGFFSTEVGMSQVLQYKLVPGRYEGCIPFEEAGGKVWA